MQHLFSSAVKVQRSQLTVVDGQATMSWQDQLAPLAYVKCRLDLNFIRQGKDALPAIEAGRAPDRVGVMFVAATVPLKAGDRIVTLSGPVSGTFDIRAIPDIALDYASGHHIEVQIIETNQQLAGVWPPLEETP